ncbi:MAG: thioredoxin family protein [Marinilabiliales bacterium]|nr:thioredoxin family protein [Marinilabiliales bacterium]
MTYRVMATPGLVIDGTVKSAGRIPSVEEIKTWLKETETTMRHPPFFLKDMDGSHPFSQPLFWRSSWRVPDAAGCRSIGFACAGFFPGGKSADGKEPGHRHGPSGYRFFQTSRDVHRARRGQMHPLQGRCSRS